MRIIIDCDQGWYVAASAIVDRVMPGWRSTYARVGWGWVEHNQGGRFFVRRIKDGLSITQVEPERMA